VAKLNRYNNLPVEGKSRVGKAIQSESGRAPGMVAHQPALRASDPMQ